MKCSVRVIGAKRSIMNNLSSIARTRENLGEVFTKDSRRKNWRLLLSLRAAIARLSVQVIEFCLPERPANVATRTFARTHRPTLDRVTCEYLLIARIFMRVDASNCASVLHSQCWSTSRFLTTRGAREDVVLLTECSSRVASPMLRDMPWELQTHRNRLWICKLTQIFYRLLQKQVATL